MSIWLIRYQKEPDSWGRRDDPQVARVEAESAAAALALLKDKLGDYLDVDKHEYQEPVEYQRPQVKGRVISLEGDAIL